MKLKKRNILMVAMLLALVSLEASAKSAAKGELNGVVNINAASVAELTMLPGVGPKRAEAIQEYVKAHPFKTVEELKEIKGIGDVGFEKLKPYVTVVGATTLKWVKTQTQAQAVQPATLPR